MPSLSRPLSATLALGAVGSLALAGCTSDDPEPASRPRVGVVLPDTTSSPRWENVDRPLLRAGFDAAGIDSDIQNAQGDRTRFQTIADGMISSGVTALLIVNLDRDSGAAVIKKAAAAGIPVIDYDRLTPGGGAQYHVSFDKVAVGAALGAGLVKCLTDQGIRQGGVVELNGSPDDDDATLLKQGYDKVIRDAGYQIVADRSVPGWDPTRAGSVFARIDTERRGRYVGVAAADDNLAGAVVAHLSRQKRAGRIAVAGRDASDEALQRLLLGTQCVSVYTSSRQEADAAVALTRTLVDGDRAGADALATGAVVDRSTGQPVKSVLLEPQSIFQANVAEVIADGATKPNRICVNKKLRAACTAAKIA